MPGSGSRFRRAADPGDCRTSTRADAVARCRSGRVNRVRDMRSVAAVLHEVGKPLEIEEIELDGSRPATTWSARSSPAAAAATGARPGDRGGPAGEQTGDGRATGRHALGGHRRGGGRTGPRAEPRAWRG